MWPQHGNMEKEDQRARISKIKKKKKKKKKSIGIIFLYIKNMYIMLSAFSVDNLVKLQIPIYISVLGNMYRNFLRKSWQPYS